MKLTSTGRLFGISREAANEWFSRGVPVDRMADVGRIADLADALQRRFKAERMPQIVRSELPGLGGRNILEIIGEQGTVAIFDLLDRAFSYIPRS